MENATEKTARERKRKRENVERARRIEHFIIATYQDPFDMQAGLIDALTDLMHLASQRTDMRFEAALENARQHFEYETK